MIKKNLLNITISLLLSFLIIYLSFSNTWTFLWNSLSIPAQEPFSDLKAHIHFYNCFKKGINIYNQPCELIPLGNANISTHPEIWLKIVDFFNLMVGMPNDRENGDFWKHVLLPTLASKFNYNHSSASDPLNIDRLRLNRLLHQTPDLPDK